MHTHKIVQGLLTFQPEPMKVESMQVGFIVGIKRALTRGLFTVIGFKMFGDDIYVQLQHENAAYESGYVRASEVFIVKDSGWNPAQYLS